jgi:hypothetical protein
MITNRIQLRSAEEIAALVEQWTCGVGTTRQPDRRSEPRYAVDLPALAQPLNEHLEPEGEPFETRVRDLSASGMRLACPTTVNHKRLAIQIESPQGKSRQLVLEVLWCRRCGDHYDLGGRLMTR